MSDLLENSDPSISSKKTLPDVLSDAVALERKGHSYRTEGKNRQAFPCFDRAGQIFRAHGEFQRAAFCFASAATCWSEHTGWQDMRNASTRTEWAARAAFQSKDFDYARSLYREAAILFEKDGDGDSFSRSFYQAQIAARKCYWLYFANPKKILHEVSGPKTKLFFRLNSFRRWIFSWISNLIWGYGEKPFRVFFISIGIMFLCSFGYYHSNNLFHINVTGPSSFYDSLYFSVITFTTVGYGDFVPLGWARLIAMLESICGITMAPLFLISLARHYLRMSN